MVTLKSTKKKVCSLISDRENNALVIESSLRASAYKPTALRSGANSLSVVLVLAAGRCAAAEVSQPSIHDDVWGNEYPAQRRLPEGDPSKQERKDLAVVHPACGQAEAVPFLKEALAEEVAVTHEGKVDQNCQTPC